MYRFLVLFALAFTYLFQTLFGSLLPVKKQAVSQNGSLSAVDALGRQSISAGESKKEVGLFYFLWLGEHGDYGPFDNTKIVSEHPEAILSEENWLNAGGGGYAAFHHWGEPLFGYYRSSDAWVLRRHCQMLTDAGVDFLVFDTTNGFPYLDRALDLIAVWHEYLLQGWKVPKLAFYTNNASGRTMNALYDGLYQNAEVKSRFPQIDALWYRMDGKPMIVGNAPDGDLRPEVREYFRIKACQWPNEEKKQDGFPWIEFDRLHTLNAYYKNSPKDKSIVSVSVAQHCETIRFSSSAWYGQNDHGRSWHNGKKDPAPDAAKWGYNFAEQWDYAIKLDPDIIFVTGFNEWVAQRFNLAEGEAIGFVDQCDTEYSRDLEPSAGVLGDNYYMQFVKYVAKFKRSRAVLPKNRFVTVDINGDFAQWEQAGITAVYRDYENETAPRDAQGFGSLRYTDDTVCNDIVNAKVAEDAEKLYFYVDTASPLSSPDGENRMTLHLNLNGKTPGYDFCVNRLPAENGKTAVEAVSADGGCQKVGDADLRFEGSRLMLQVAKSLLGLPAGQKAAFTFKWTDGCAPNDVLSFYLGGEAAPYGRLNWVYGANK